MGDLLFKTKATSAAPWQGDHYHFRISWHSLEGGCLMTRRLCARLWVSGAGPGGAVRLRSAARLRGRAPGAQLGMEGVMLQEYEVTPMGGRAKCSAPFRPCCWSISCLFPSVKARWSYRHMAWGCMGLWHLDDHQCTLKSCFENPMRTLVPLNIDGYLMNTIKMFLFFFFPYYLWVNGLGEKKNLIFRLWSSKENFAWRKKY